MLTMGTTERRKYDCQSWAGEDIVTSVLLALGVFTLIEASPCVARTLKQPMEMEAQWGMI